MKVCISVHGRFHAFELARGLHRRGLLECLLTTYPAFATRRIVGTDATLRTAPWLEIRRRLYPRLRIGPQPDLAISEAFGRFAAGALKNIQADVLVGWSSATLEAIPVAKAKGMKVVIERGSTHITHQTEELVSEYRRHGQVFQATTPGMVERELREYELADAIAVPSRFAARTFIERGIPECKLIVAPMGVDLQRFSPTPENTSNRLPRILFVGAVGLRKGVPMLLRAFARLKDKAELHFVGPVEENFRSILSDLPLDNVVVRGPIASEVLQDLYAEADIFCLPSVEEGFGMVVTEAMACGLPPIVTERVGASEMITPGESGMIVANGDETALADALLKLVSDPTLRQNMGAAARERVMIGCGWDDYVTRATTAYEKLLA